jgi:adenylate cyclase
MADEGFKRKLTAILSADAVGYSRLMAEDEAATVKTLATYREIISSLIKQNRGRVVDSPGDNVLAEFSSVVDAVQCAVAVQNEFETRNAKLPENRRMEFRKRQFNSTHPALMGFCAILKNNPQKSKNNSYRKIQK